MSTKNVFINNLKKIRLEKNISTYKLAQAISTTPTQIQRLENGERTLTLEWAIRLAKCLKCTPAEILGKCNNYGENSLLNLNIEKSISIPCFENLNENKMYPVAIDKDWLKTNYNINDPHNLFIITAPNNLNLENNNIKKNDILICQKTDYITKDGIFLVKEDNNITLIKIEDHNNLKTKIIAKVIIILKQI